MGNCLPSSIAYHLQFIIYCATREVWTLKSSKISMCIYLSLPPPPAQFQINSSKSPPLKSLQEACDLWTYILCVLARFQNFAENHRASFRILFSSWPFTRFNKQMKKALIVFILFLIDFIKERRAIKFFSIIFSWSFCTTFTPLITYL